MYQDGTVVFPPLSTNQSSPSSLWSRLHDKRFEEALVVFPDDLPDRWKQIGEYLNKSPSDVQEHYELLIHDVNEIDLGRVELPSYADEELNDWDSAPSNQISFGSGGGGGGGGGGKGSKGGEAERKKGTPWTEEEHKLFLIGLRKYGKGDWRSISRNVVISRTPTQVASHAQKYFLRQNSGKKDRKRSSIHDITTVPNGLVGQIDENSVPPMAALIQQPQMLHQMPHQMPPMNHLADQESAVTYQGYGYYV